MSALARRAQYDTQHSVLEALCESKAAVGAVRQAQLRVWASTILKKLALTLTSSR